MDCEGLQAYLAAYLDDELDVAHTLDIQKHILDCAACHRIHAEGLALRSALNAADLRAHPSDDAMRRFDQAVRRAADQDAIPLDSPRVRLSRFVLAAVALFAVATVTGSLFYARVRSRHQANMSNAVLAAHIRSLQIDHLVDVRSSDRHTVKPWFQGKLDFSPPISDLSEQGWRLAGGRLDYLDDRPVAALVYQHGTHNVNVFLWPERDSRDHSIQQEVLQGYQIRHWNNAGMTYWVVCDLDSSELLGLTRILGGH